MKNHKLQPEPFPPDGPPLDTAADVPGQQPGPAIAASPDYLHLRNEIWLTGLLQRCAAVLGPGTFKRDDGTVSQNPLLRRVPDLLDHCYRLARVLLEHVHQKHYPQNILFTPAENDLPEILDQLDRLIRALGPRLTGSQTPIGPPACLTGLAQKMAVDELRKATLALVRSHQANYGLPVAIPENIRQGIARLHVAVLNCPG